MTTSATKKIGKPIIYFAITLLWGSAFSPFSIWTIVAIFISLLVTNIGFYIHIKEETIDYRLMYVVLGFTLLLAILPLFIFYKIYTI